MHNLFTIFIVQFVCDAFVNGNTGWIQIDSSQEIVVKRWFAFIHLIIQTHHTHQEAERKSNIMTTQCLCYLDGRQVLG